MSPEQFAGVLLIASPVIGLASFGTLMRTFDYPAILRRPSAEILQRFRDGGRSLRVAWYGLVASALLVIPVAILVHGTLASVGGPFVLLATTFGVLAGVVQALGLLRWPFLVPRLAEIHGDTNQSVASRDAAAVAFVAFHEYLGVAVGEHLGYLFTGLWAILVASAMTASSAFDPWLAPFGLIPGAAILVGVLEPAGIKAAGPVNAVGYLLFFVWLLATGVLLLF